MIQRNMTQRNMAHRIRLRKPWERYDQTLQMHDGGKIVASDVPTASSESHVDVPDLSRAEFTGSSVATNPVYRATYLRKFHRPSGIEPDDRVQLEVGAVRGRIAEIRINAIVISDHGEFDRNPSSSNRLELDDRLVDHNELEIELESTADVPGHPRLVGDVNLWIITTTGP